MIQRNVDEACKLLGYYESPVANYTEYIARTKTTSLQSKPRGIMLFCLIIVRWSSSPSAYSRICFDRNSAAREDYLAYFVNHPF